ncbi:hypothetical protein HDU76_010617 [Blyttiomyces sp. JEL0837]|nr:hypothetical protein HDU76_010617 [Blyttiomyces sp. JEL0837]
MIKPGRNVNISKLNSFLGGDAVNLGADISVFGQTLGSNTERDVDEKSTCSTIAKRASNGVNYTSISNRVIISVNPSRVVQNEEEASVKRSMKFQGSSDDIEVIEVGPTTNADEAAAHIFQLVESAYLHMMQGHSDQAILLIGEANSGKSFSHSLIKTHLCNVSRKNVGSLKIETRIHSVIQALQLFVCGVTSLTPNSSLFGGALIEYQFNDGVLVGFKTLLFPLSTLAIQTSSPSSVDAGRCFHVFYNMLSTITDEERKELDLGDASRFAFLNRYRSRSHLVDSSLNSTTLRSRLKNIGMRASEVSILFRILAFILHLGNVIFSSLEEDKEGCGIKDDSVLTILSGLFGLEKMTLKNMLLYRSIRPRQDSDSFTVILMSSEASARRDSLARMLYVLAVQWIVRKINSKMCREEREWDNFISVADFRGPEKSFFNNSDRVNVANQTQNLQEFMTSFAHHKIFQFFQQRIITDQDRLYADEGITAYGSSVSKQSSLGDVWFETADTIIKVLDEKTKSALLRARGDRDFDVEFLTDLRRHTSNCMPQAHPSDYKAGHKHQKHNKTFMVTHNNSNLARYDATNWVEQNNSGDIVTTQLVSCITGTDPMSELLREILSPADNAPSADPMNDNSGDPSPQKAATRFTAVSELKDSMNDLIDALANTSIWVGIHIRMSDNPATPFRMDPEVLLRQVRSWNIVSFAHSLATLHTASFTHREFKERYDILLSNASPSLVASVSTLSRGLGLCQEADGMRDIECPENRFAAILATQFEYGDLDITVGKSRVFLSETAWRELESRLGSANAQRSGTVSKLSATGGGPGIISQDNTASPVWNLGDDDEEEEDLSGDFGSAGGDNLHLGEVYVSREDDLNDDEDHRRWRKAEGFRNAFKNDKSVIVEKVSATRSRWLCLTWTLTWWIPSFFLRVFCKIKRPDIQIAWREKVALCIIIALLCGIVLFLIIGLELILCPRQNVLSQGEIDGLNSLSNPYISLYGAYYRIPDILKTHISQNNYLNSGAMQQTTLGRDVSAMFYKTTVWQNYCPLQQPSAWDNLDRVIPEDAMRVWYPHQGNDATNNNRPIDYISEITYMRKGFVARDPTWIQTYIASDPTRKRLLIAYDRVFDVTTYLDPTNTNNFLGDNIRRVINELGQSGLDVTSLLEQVKRTEGLDMWGKYMTCLNGLFFGGVIDHRKDLKCVISNYILLVSTIVLCLVIGMKFITAFQCSSKASPEEHDRFVICQVPCYTEGLESLKKTFDSLLFSKYRDSNKLLLVISDGMIVGSGNDRPTPKIVLDCLGYPSAIAPDPPSLMFESLGDGMKQLNYGKVYSGWYNQEGRFLPYIVIVKVGTPQETNKPGNRGKRDTQLLVMRLLSRLQLNEAMNPLELEVIRQMTYNLEIDTARFEFVLWVDADTEVMSDAINRLISFMATDSKVVGLCGETVLANEMESWVTMIQVYEYFISHHLSKAFESVFGAVTCLPGCFCMYRLRTPNTNLPLLTSPSVLKDFSINKVDTLHLKNLLHLGEDRYLTTLMMKHFPSPRFKLCFTPDAKCKTHAPARWRVLVSQRRRWINSTVHTLIELLRLPELCGCGLFSMRALVMFDLFATMVQPSAIIYIAFLIVSSVLDQSLGIPLISLIMIAAIYGGQVLIFMFKGEFQHIGWMLLYILAIPVYSFYLPIYAFWHFDDFSWGNTRMVVDDTGAILYDKLDEHQFDPSSIPKRCWQEYEQELLGIIPQHGYPTQPAPSVVGSMITPSIHEQQRHSPTQVIPMSSSSVSVTSFNQHRQSPPNLAPQMQIPSKPKLFMSQSPPPPSEISSVSHTITPQLPKLSPHFNTRVQNIHNEPLGSSIPSTWQRSYNQGYFSGSGSNSGNGGPTQGHMYGYSGQSSMAAIDGGHAYGGFNHPAAGAGVWASKSVSVPGDLAVSVIGTRSELMPGGDVVGDGGIGEGTDGDKRKALKGKKGKGERRVEVGGRVNEDEEDDDDRPVGQLLKR